MLINWKIRYAAIIKGYPELSDPGLSVLEIGSGSWGIAAFLQRDVVGVELDKAVAHSPRLTLIRGDVKSLPMRSGSFDIVLCVDLMEHLDASDRMAAIAEMLRVTRRKLIVSCPVKHFATAGEAQLIHCIESRQMRPPVWLLEHRDNGLPGVDDVARCIHSAGYGFAAHVNEGMLQHYAGLMLDLDFPLTRQLLYFHNEKTAFEAPIQAAEWDLYYSVMFSIDRHVHDVSRLPALPAVRFTRSAPTEGQTYAVYAVCHNRALLPELGPITPIFAGDAAENDCNHELTDILATGFRLPNRRWSELSGIYRIWKDGPQTEIVGFCHYRRFFDFLGRPTAQRETLIPRSLCTDFCGFFLDANAIQACGDGVAFVAQPIRVEMNVWDHYAYAHNGRDMLTMLSILSQDYPHLLPYAYRQFESDELYGSNMFIMRREGFEALCEPWFDIMQRIELAAGNRQASSYQLRDISFVSERIFDILIRDMADRGVLSLREMPIYFVDTNA